MSPANPSADLVAIIDKAAGDLKRATTLSYQGDSLLSLNTAIDRICNRVADVISDLEKRPNV